MGEARTLRRRCDEWRCLAYILLAMTFCPLSVAVAAAPDKSVEELQSLSIEDLAHLEVTSVAKHPQSLSAAAAAIYVITSDDIRRSGAINLPEVLRLAPNLEIARLNAYSYTISARGMNSLEAANKLLVLIDGRAVHEPIGAGVLWQQVDMVASSIDRVEVISGPGGVLWGANAVNGVINVITRSSRDQQGAGVEVIGGDRESDLVLRLGGKLPGDTHFVFNLAGFERAGLVRAPGDISDDRFHGQQGNLRIDGGGTSANFSLAAGLYQNKIGGPGSTGSDTGGGGDLSGGHLMGRWAWRTNNSSDFEISAYVARDRRIGADFRERRDTYDLQAQQGLTLGRHQLVWGGEYRLWQETYNTQNYRSFKRASADISVASIFAQDELAISPTLNLIFGLKLENNSYTGWDWMPNLRAAWQRDKDELVWAAVSRAVRTPDRIEREQQAPNFLVPSNDFMSETLWAYELGYRAQPTSQLSLSIQAFFNQYNELRVEEHTRSYGYLVLPLRIRNGAEGETYGLEAWGAYSPRPGWRLRAGVSTLHKTFRVKPGHDDVSHLEAAGADPAFQVQVRSEMNLRPDLDLDVGLRRIADVKPVIGPAIAHGYTEASVRLGWRVTDRLELSVTGDNLLNDHHREFREPLTTPARAVPRTLTAALRWRF